MGNLFLPIMSMNVHLNQDGSVGKEREENDADHGETPNLQGRQSWNKHRKNCECCPVSQLIVR